MVKVCRFVNEKKAQHQLGVVSKNIHTLTNVSFLQGHTPDFPPNKLKVGCGEHCLWVLDRLADEALKAKNFTWKTYIDHTNYLFSFLVIMVIGGVLCTKKKH